MKRLRRSAFLGCAAVLAGCMTGPVPTTGERVPEPDIERDALLSVAAACHLLRARQSADPATTDATVAAAARRYGFSLREIRNRSKALLRLYPADGRDLSADARDSCARLADLTGVAPALVRLDRSPDVGSASAWVRVSGAILDGYAERVIREIRRRSASGVIIESEGGSVYEARRLGRFLRSNGLTTAVDGVCLSACVDVLAGGVTRLITPSAKLGIHRSRVPERVSSHEGGQAYVAEAALYLREMGVDDGVALVAAAVPHDEIYLISTENALRTRLATRVARAL